MLPSGISINKFIRLKSFSHHQVDPSTLYPPLCGILSSALTRFVRGSSRSETRGAAWDIGDNKIDNTRVGVCRRVFVLFMLSCSSLCVLQKNCFMNIAKSKHCVDVVCVFLGNAWFFKKRQSVCSVAISQLAQFSLICDNCANICGFLRCEEALEIAKLTAHSIFK